MTFEPAMTFDDEPVNHKTCPYLGQCMFHFQLTYILIQDILLSNHGQVALEQDPAAIVFESDLIFEEYAPEPAFTAPEPAFSDSFSASVNMT